MNTDILIQDLLNIYAQNDYGIKIMISNDGSFVQETCRNAVDAIEELVSARNHAAALRDEYIRRYETALRDLSEIRSCVVCRFNNDSLCKQASGEDESTDSEQHKRWAGCRGSAKLNWEYRGCE